MCVLVHVSVFVCIGVRLLVCVCVRERERASGMDCDEGILDPTRLSTQLKRLMLRQREYNSYVIG